MAIITLGVCTNQLLVACLVGRAVASDVVVVACEAEAVGMAADEGGHGEQAVAPSCGAACPLTPTHPGMARTNSSGSLWSRPPCRLIVVSSLLS